MKKLIAILSVVMIVVGCKEQPKVEVNHSDQSIQIDTTKIDSTIDTVYLECVKVDPETECCLAYIKCELPKWASVSINNDTLKLKNVEIVNIFLNNDEEYNWVTIQYTPTKHPNKTNKWNIPGMVIDYIK